MLVITHVEQIHIRSKLTQVRQRSIYASRYSDILFVYVPGRASPGIKYAPVLHLRVHVLPSAVHHLLAAQE